MVLERVDVVGFDDTGCDLLDKEVNSHFKVFDVLRAAGKLRGESN